METTMNTLKEEIIRRIAAFPGNTSIFFKDLTSGESWGYHEEEPMRAASVIKLTVMAELFRAIEAGEVSRDQKILLKDEDRVPICGVLTLLHSGIELTPIDLCWLMITISDNMATNLLINLLTPEKIQQNNLRLGLHGMVMNRRMFDQRPGYREKSNSVSALGSAQLLEMIWKKQLVSREASEEMLEMLLAQQCTNKMPLLLPGEGVAAHKTGEDDGVSHDVGIVLAKKPFIVCFVNHQLEEDTAGELNILIGQITKELFDFQGGLPEQAD